MSKDKVVIEEEVTFDNLENKLCPIIEVQKKLCKHFLIASRLYEEQHCYRDYKSCSTYLINMKEYLGEK